MPFSMSLSLTRLLSAKPLKLPSVPAPPPRQAFSLIITWSSGLILPFFISAATT